MANPLSNIFDLLASPGGRRTVSRTFRSALARLSPEEEAVILGNIQANLPEIASRSAAGGQTFNPRTGEFVETMYGNLPSAAQDAGYIMAPRAELPGARAYLPDMPLDPDDIADIQAAMVAERVQELLQNPQMLEDLQRGGMLGSWASGPAVVVDPSRQYLSRAGSIRAGRASGQEAGFAPRYGEYPVTGPEADAVLRRRNARIAAAALAAMAGGAGVLAAQD
jgi:hypothetical protein